MRIARSSFVIGLICHTALSCHTAISTLASGADHATHERLWHRGLGRDLKAGRDHAPNVIEARRGVVMNGAKSVALPNGASFFALKDQPDGRIDGVVLCVASRAQAHAREAQFFTISCVH